MNIYKHIKAQKKEGKKGFAVLIDPDKCHGKQLEKLMQLSLDAHIDYFLIGGSLMSQDNLSKTIRQLKTQETIPCLLFPGSTFQIDSEADALLYLSVISGRNPDLLIGRHVESAPIILQSGIETISTGYMLIDGGRTTAVNYMSNTMPIPYDKDQIAVATALAGAFLGMQMIYLEAGSGAYKSVSPSMIKAVKDQLTIPLIVGGGIKTPEDAYEKVSAGADIIVVGNAIEKDPELIIDMSSSIHSVNTLV